MSQFKINYGIDLGTTNSAICRIKEGNLQVIKSDKYQKDTTPSCVHFSKRKQIYAGDRAYFPTPFLTDPTNTFTEFKRNMGKDFKYYSSNMNEYYSPEYLSSEILKSLKNYIKDEDLNSAVITVPAKFFGVQYDATKRAAEMAGFCYCELLQEPIAASLAFAVEYKTNDGFWLVFDFGGGTFDAALMSSSEGIMKVIDTEGDNHLGGKNLDLAIVDDILIPYITENYGISKIKANKASYSNIRNYLKYYAEYNRIDLSIEKSIEFNTEGVIEIKDDEGRNISFDELKIKRDSYNKIAEPIFQRAINLTNTLLERNNLKGNDLITILMVGGPTFTPLMRQMIKEQITPDLNISIDPMTVVAKGAAIYASTREIPINYQKRDLTKIQLILSNTKSTIEREIKFSIKIDKDKTKGTIPIKLFLDIERSDRSWATGKIELDEDFAIFDLQLMERKNNVFKIFLYDYKGNILKTEPSEFTILHGTTIPKAVMPADLGAAIDIQTDVGVKTKLISIIKKNTSIPTSGKQSGFKTQKDLRPGNKNDKIEIDILEGENDTNYIYNRRRKKLFITGEMISQFLPKGSEISIEIKVDSDAGIRVFVDIPQIDEEIEFKIESGYFENVLTEEVIKEIDSIVNKFEYTKKVIEDGYKLDPIKITKIEGEIIEINKIKNKGMDDTDTNEMLKNRTNDLQKELDKIEDKIRWTVLNQNLVEIVQYAEQNNERWGNDKTTNDLNHIKSQIEIAKKEKDYKILKKLSEDLNSLSIYILTLQPSFWIKMIMETDSSFNTIDWKQGMQKNARLLINQAKTVIASGYTEEVRDCMFKLWDCMLDGDAKKTAYSDRPER